MQLSSHKARLATAMAVLLAIFIAACARPVSAPTSPGNRPPVITSLIFPAEVMPATENHIACTATDADGDILEYQWTADGGTLRGEGAAVTWVAPDAAGTYTIKIVVADGKGGEASKRMIIEVLSDADDSISTAAILKLSVPSAQPVMEQRRTRIWMATTITCIVENAATDVNYQWSTTGGKLQGKGIKEGTANSVVWVAPGVAGDYTVSVTATDSKGNQASGQVNFTVLCCAE